ncbi:MAG: hypothetical protein QXS50_04530 [Candidatus Caldarchaeum sp.]
MTWEKLFGRYVKCPACGKAMPLASLVGHAVAKHHVNPVAVALNRRRRGPSQGKTSLRFIKGKKG